MLVGQALVFCAKVTQSFVKGALLLVLQPLAAVDACYEYGPRGAHVIAS